MIPKPNLTHVFLTGYLFNELIEKGNAEPYGYSQIGLCPLRTRNLNDIKLEDEVLRFHEFFESEKVKKYLNF